MYLSQSMGAGSTTPAMNNPQQGTTLLNAAPTVSGANAAATVTLTGVAGQRISVRGIYVKATGAAATPSITVQDGATVVLDLGSPTFVLNGPAQSFTGAPLLTATAGNNVVINVGAGGALAVTTTSVIADRQ